MTPEEARARLRDILAELYPDEASIKRITGDAGLDWGRISVDPKVINTWDSVLAEAQNSGSINSLFRVVKNEYGTNQNLLDAVAGFVLSDGSGGKSDGGTVASNTPTPALSVPRYFIYVSDSKIDMLYDQLSPQGVLLKHEGSRYRKLSTVVARLEGEGQIGTPSDIKPYVRGCYLTHYDFAFSRRGAVLFYSDIGREHIVIMTGSSHHVIGHPTLEQQSGHWTASLTTVELLLHACNADARKYLRHKQHSALDWIVREIVSSFGSDENKLLAERLDFTAVVFNRYRIPIDSIEENLAGKNVLFCSPLYVALADEQ